MSWQVIDQTNVPPNPWRNGGGMTRELVAWPSADNWHWRLSVAEVSQSGPFSNYQGVQRWFAVLSGDGVQLNMHDGNHNVDANGAPFFFDGAAAVHCHLLGSATQDFNLMLRTEQPRHAKGHDALSHSLMVRVTDSLSITLTTPKIIVVYAIDTSASVFLFDDVLTLYPGQLAWRQSLVGESITLRSSNALWMEIER